MFLTLAFILPGFVYLAFFMLYFGDLYTKIAANETLNNSLVYQAGLVIVVGLLFTSVCWGIELFLRQFDRFASRFPSIEYKEIPLFESNQKSSSYLFQLSGQAVMHFNIWVGTSILLVLYILRTIILFGLCGLDSFSVIIGLIIILVNYFISKNLFKWSSYSIGKINDP